MALQFVLGKAGAGKTRYLYEEVIRRSIEEPDFSYLVIVPEQFTMQAQREMIRLHPNHGMMNIDVVSFKRLAYRVFDELNVRLPAVLDDMGKSMVLRRVMGPCKKSLGLYGGHLGQPGFINQMKSQLSELYQYGVGPEDLKELGEQTDNALLAQKLKDLEIIFRQFQEYIRDHYITAEEILDILCRELPKSERIRRSVIFLDGYTGFTPVQYRLIRLFLTCARDVVCAVTVDPAADPYRESGIQNLFYMSKHTVCRIREMAEEEKVSKKKDVIIHPSPGPRFLESPSLDFLEANLYRYGRRTWQGQPGEVEIFCGKDPDQELEWVLETMEDLVRHHGMRYRNMAIVTGDLASYGRIAARQLEQAGIPYFMDQKKSILENPMVELIRAAVELARDFSYENVFRYLKTGLVYDREPVPEGGYGRIRAAEEVWRLENYVRALGINGWKRWNETWERTFYGAENLNLEELNRFRMWVLKPLAPLREVMSAPEATIASMTQGLKSYLEEMELQEKLEEYQSYFSERGQFGDENLSREYGQVYDLVLELLERLTGLLGEEKVDRKTYGQILDAGFEEIQVGTIPATIDQVTVGDITRSRLDGVKALFFVGVNDQIVPQRKNGGSLLTDRDREFFRLHRMELAPTAREESCMQKFYLYLMLTKPSRRLYLSYGAAGADGKAMRPSILIGEVRKLFPDLKLLSGQEETGTVYTLQDGKHMLIQGLGRYRDSREKEEEWKGEPDFLELCRFFLDHGEEGEKLKRLVEGAFYSYQEKGIGKAAARALYGPILQGSVTRMEQYASCAYAHFLRYGLELLERQEYRLEAVDVGNLFHQSIDLCFRKVKEEERDWRTLSDEERDDLAKSCVRQVVEQYGNTILMSSARYAYLARRVEQMTERTIWALGEQVKRGDFTPVGFEVSFSASDNLRAMRIPLGEGQELRLRGRIDRLDLCREDKNLYVKIIDYKSGGTHFDLSALYYGLQLQLVVYMDAAQELLERQNPGDEVIPAGIFYYNIQDPVIEKKGPMTDEEIQQEILRQLRMNGLVNRNLEVIRHLDRDIETQSDVIPVALKAGIIQESRSSVTDAKGFEGLKTYVIRRLRQAGREILEGQTDLAPYKETGRTACDYCPYHAVCGFDTKTAGYGYRRLKALKPQEIWEEILREEGPGRTEEEHGSKMDG